MTARVLVGPRSPAPPWIPDTPVPVFVGTVGTVAIGAADTLILSPLVLPRGMRCKGLVYRCVTGGAGSSIKAGIWAAEIVSGAWRPGGLPLRSNNTGGATTANNVDVQLDFASPVWLQPGRVYFAGIRATGTLPSMLANNSGNTYALTILGGTARTANKQGVSAVIGSETYATDIATSNCTGATFAEITAGLAIPHLVPA